MTPTVIVVTGRELSVRGMLTADFLRSFTMSTSTTVTGAAGASSSCTSTGPQTPRLRLSPHLLEDESILLTSDPAGKPVQSVEDRFSQKDSAPSLTGFDTLAQSTFWSWGRRARLNGVASVLWIPVSCCPLAALALTQAACSQQALDLLGQSQLGCVS
jgi:hypothetical protein